MFHHDPQLTGDAGTSVNLQVPCNAPTATPTGYYMVGTDGGVFNFGNLPFCGSTGAITLNQPVVGIATTQNAGGYWMVARDGGVFAFGDAGSYNSLPGLGVSVSDVAGIVPTSSGHGYYMIGRDGGRLRLRRRRLHRVPPRHQRPRQQHRGHRADGQRPRVLDGRLRRRGLRLR